MRRFIREAGRGVLVVFWKTGGHSSPGYPCKTVIRHSEELYTKNNFRRVAIGTFPSITSILIKAHEAVGTDGPHQDIQISGQCHTRVRSHASLELTDDIDGYWTHLCT
jgi:hypothetical protein